MTEKEWLTSRQADAMLRWLLEPVEVVRTRWHGTRSWPRRVSERKVRLFACACGRILEGALSTGGRISDAVEGWIEGRTPLGKLDPVLDQLEREEEAVIAAATGSTFPRREILRGLLLQPRFGLDSPFAAEALRAASGMLLGHETDLLREIVGNPFRPAHVTPAVLAWNDGTVPRLAEAIAEGRSFADMPILGDALEEAGCADERLAAHCRNGGPHAVGCWALDAVLGNG